MNGKKLLMIFAMPVVGIATLVFASAIALATFVEHLYETNAARALVYNATWFEALLAYIAIALVVNVFTKRMIRKGRIGVILFHFSVLFILLGAAVSRYAGMQGVMHIRENSSSNMITSSDVFFDVQLKKKGVLMDGATEKVFPSLLSRRFFSERFSVDGNRFKVSVEDYQLPENHGAVAFVRVEGEGQREEHWVRKGAGTELPAVEVKLNDYTFELSFGTKPFTVPFRVQLDTFEIARYPGSMSPSSFKSYVTVLDSESYKAEIYMNHVLEHRGYRFFQSSYDDDEKGTVLSVNADPIGTNITYFGYFLLIAGMILALFDGKSRFKGLLNSSKHRHITATIVLFAVSSLGSIMHGQSTNLAQKNAIEFGQVCMQTADGRIKPINSFALEILRKVHKSPKYQNYLPEEVLLGIMREPDVWKNEMFIANGNQDVKQFLRLESKHISFAQCFDDASGAYLLKDELVRINQTPPEQRTKTDNSFISLDERVNIFNMLKNGRLLNIVPNINSEQAPWFDLYGGADAYRNGSDSISMVFNVFIEGLIVGGDEQFESSMEIIHAWQKSIGKNIMPSDLRIKSELFYNKVNVFERLTLVYGVLSVLFLVFSIWLLVKQNKILHQMQTALLWLLIIAFGFHTIGLVLRGIIAGHVPLSNGYEAMVFVAWTSLLAGIIFLKQSRLVMALFGFLAAAALLVSHLSFMNPQITTLVPVLKSYWLTVHVAVITSSYGFLGGSFVMGVITLVMMLVLNDKNKYKLGPVIRNLITLNRIIMIPGLYLISIGCFLGGIWANQSWGNYWSWDPKETWCLVSILVYSFVVHLHHFPGMRGKFIFVIASIVSYATIIMTFFGVNYFLGGMHSYAGEGSVSIPGALYIVVPLLILAIWKANRNNKKYLSLMYC